MWMDGRNGWHGDSGFGPGTEERARALNHREMPEDRQRLLRTSSMLMSLIGSEVSVFCLSVRLSVHQCIQRSIVFRLVARCVCRGRWGGAHGCAGQEHISLQDVAAYPPKLPQLAWLATEEDVPAHSPTEDVGSEDVQLHTHTCQLSLCALEGAVLPLPGSPCSFLDILGIGGQTACSRRQVQGFA
jgi:hypothetical protein